MSGLKIDETFVKISEGESITILEAAKKSGITIPTLCECKDLNVKGNCRLCMVEVEGKGLVTACSTQALDNMIVKTNSDIVTQHRRSVMELILANHNRNCPNCEGNKTCRLQKIADDLNIVQEDYEEVFVKCEKKRFKSTLIINRNRCIKCGRCKAICGKINRKNAIGILGRGWEERFYIDFEECNACGKCAEVCPVGCLNLERHLEKAWEYIDANIKEKLIVFILDDIDRWRNEIYRKTDINKEIIFNGLHRIGFQEILFEKEDGSIDDAEQALKIRERVKNLYKIEEPCFVIVTKNTKWKHLVDELPFLAAILTPEDLIMLLEQSMYDINNVTE